MEYHGVDLKITIKTNDLIKCIDDFFEKNIEIDWQYILYENRATDNLFNNNFEFFEKYSRYLNWNIVSRRPDLTCDFIEKFANFIEWDLISSCNDKLTREFIEKHIDKLNINELINHDERKKVNFLIDQDFIEKYVNISDLSEYSWLIISNSFKLNDKFIFQYFHKLDHTTLYSNRGISKRIKLFLKDYI